MAHGSGNRRRKLGLGRWPRRRLGPGGGARARFVPDGPCAGDPRARLAFAPGAGADAQRRIDPRLGAHDRTPARLVEHRLGAASGGARSGGILGWSAALIIAGARLGGELVAAQAGLSTASLFDPDTGEETTVLGRLYGWIALAVFLALDGPLILIRALIESYRAVPAGRLLISQETAELAFGQVGRALELSLRVAAAPAALALTLAGIVLGWLSRAAPSLPFVALALPIRTVVGVVLIMLSLATLIVTLASAWDAFPF